MFYNYEVMLVSLMVSEEEVLAVSRLNVGPVFLRLVNGCNSRMLVIIIPDLKLIQQCI